MTATPEIRVIHHEILGVLVGERETLRQLLLRGRNVFPGDMLVADESDPLLESLLVARLQVDPRSGQGQLVAAPMLWISPQVAVIHQAEPELAATARAVFDAHRAQAVGIELATPAGAEQALATIRDTTRTRPRR